MTSVSLDIKKFCIETASKRVYEQLLCRYFDRSASHQYKAMTELQIGMLKYFLEHADFEDLRRRHSELTGGRSDQALLIADAHHKEWRIICNDKSIEPEWKDLLRNE